MSIADDYKSVDFVQQVTYLPAGGDPINDVTAWQSPPTRPVVGSDNLFNPTCEFHIGSDQLTDVIPKHGDQITDAGGETWLVERLDYIAPYMYGLPCSLVTGTS